jgi:hypothetical protein
VNIDRTVCATAMAARLLKDVSLPARPVNASKWRSAPAGMRPLLSPEWMKV